LIDHTPTSVIPRTPSDTGQLAAYRETIAPVAAACPYDHHPRAWQRARTVALILTWVALAEAAYVLGRFGLLLAGWR
jgi:hypothetical protein